MIEVITIQLPEEIADRLWKMVSDAGLKQDGDGLSLFLAMVVNGEVSPSVGNPHDAGGEAFRSLAQFALDNPDVLRNVASSAAKLVFGRRTR